MANPSYKLLVIDSDSADAELTCKLLAQKFPGCELVTVSDTVSFVEQLTEGKFSAVISEQDLGWAKGLEILATFSKKHPATRTILFATTLPDEVHGLQQNGGLSAYAQKSSSGFLHLPEIVESVLVASQPGDTGTAFWSKTLKKLDEPALSILADGRVVEGNIAAATILGFQQADDLAGQRLLSLFDINSEQFPTDESLSNELAATLHESKDAIEVHAAPLRDVKKIGRRCLSIWPIPNSTRLAVIFPVQVAEQSTSDAVTGDYQDQYKQLLYAVSHDLQEPLQLVSRHASLLQEINQEALDEDGLRIVSNLVNHAQLMQSMLDDLLEYSRIGSLDSILTEVDLNEVLYEVYTLYRSKIKAVGGKVRKAGLPTVMADRSQMIRLFQNLVGNAIKFRGNEPPVITISASVVEEGWELMVKDNGIGVAPDQLEQIFTMFKRLPTQNETPGNGMGLALCEQIVKAHGGRIWARSGGKDSGGTTFYFTLNKAGSLQDNNPKQNQQLNEVEHS